MGTDTTFTTFAPTAALLLLGACWREGPGPAPPPLRPEPAPDVATAAGTTSPTARRTGWRPSGRRPIPPPDPTRKPENRALDLAVDLTQVGPTLLPSFVAGPIVVLDLDAGTIVTACDAAAVTAAQTWGAMLSDPKRPRPHCRGLDQVMCSQFATPNILIIELADPDQWRIVSVVVGNMRAGRATMNTKIAQMRSLIATAACP